MLVPSRPPLFLFPPPGSLFLVVCCLLLLFLTARRCTMSRSSPPRPSSSRTNSRSVHIGESNFHPVPKCLRSLALRTCSIYSRNNQSFRAHTPKNPRVCERRPARCGGLRESSPTTRDAPYIYARNTNNRFMQTYAIDDVLLTPSIPE